MGARRAVSSWNRLADRREARVIVSIVWVAHNRPPIAGRSVVRRAGRSASRPFP